MKHFVTKPLHVATVLLLLCAVGFAAWYVVAHRSPTPPPFELGKKGALDLQRAYWQGRVEAVGGVAAYREFSRFASQNVLTAQHQLAHAFGEALYSVEREQGVSVCDEQFAYGCFHVVLGKAIADHGLSDVAVLDTWCRRALPASFDSCEHGIGHGITAYLGYTEEALTRALGVCKGLGQDTATPGCYSGVFMEYNARTMLGTSAVVRPLVGGDIFAPCDSLAYEYRYTCTFWQPQWWVNGVYGSKPVDEALYRNVGALCDRAGDTASVRACYQGLGNITPERAGYSSDVSVLLCKASSKSVTNQLYCVSAVANVISDYRTREEGRHICGSFTGAALSYCLDYANGKANLFHPKGAFVQEHI